jgi:Tol biopolymer transport system component
MDQSWLQGDGRSGEPPGVFQLVYISTDDTTTEGTTEIRSLLSDGSNDVVLLHEPMLVMDLVSSPDGERIAFWGCPGSLANDCLPGEDLDVWTVNWDGTNLTNLTEDSAQDDSHPDWSPDGKQIVFDSRRSGTAEIYIMNSDGNNPHVITNGPGENTEPKWSPDGKWIAFHCNPGAETRICVVSPEGEPAGESIRGTSPAWSPASLEGEARLAFLCFQTGQSDICTARPAGSEMTNLTNSPADEHSAAWSPDGSWLVFVSNRGGDVDIYKVCLACPGEAEAVRLTDEVRFAMWPAWSPDSSQLAYADEPGGSLLLVKANRSGVTYLAGSVFGAPVWRAGTQR